MPQTRSLQSEQQFETYLAGFQDLSYSAANLLMQYTTALLIQLSQLHLTVKLAESLIVGVVLQDPVSRWVADKITDRLDSFYQGYASQLTMTMLQDKPTLNNAQVLSMASAKLSDNLDSLSRKNAERALAMKQQLGPDAASKDNKNDDYTPPKKSI
jgi:hypothetical protein